VQHRKLWTSLLGSSGLVLSSVICLHPADAATYSSLPTYEAGQAHILLVSNGAVLQSQRPRYLSESARSTHSRFSQSSGTNPWGLGPITPDEGVVTLRPGETYCTAAVSDLGARAAGATHGHALVTSAVGMAE
jgi:hypothetical protein